MSPGMYFEKIDLGLHFGIVFNCAFYLLLHITDFFSLYANLMPVQPGTSHFLLQPIKCLSQNYKWEVLK